MKLCFVTHRFVRTHGQGRVNLEAAIYLAKQGWRVCLVGEEVEPDALANRKIASHRVSESKLPTALLQNCAFARKAGRHVRELRNNSETLVVSNGACMDEIADVNVANFVHAAWWRSPMHPRVNRLPGQSVAWTQYQSLYTWLGQRSERRAYTKAKHVVAVSEVVKRELTDLVGVESGRVSVIHPGVDLDEFAPAPPAQKAAFRETVGTSSVQPVAVFAGDIRTNRKNLDLVLRALQKLPGLELWVAGSTKGSPYPEMAKHLGVSKRVKWLGHRSDMGKVMQAADMLLFPSHYEPFGLVVLEAMASGLAVVTTKQTGASDVVGDAGELLHDGQDLETLVQIVERWVESPAELRTIQGRARKAAERHSWEAMGKQYAQLIQKLMPQPRAAVG